MDRSGHPSRAMISRVDLEQLDGNRGVCSSLEGTYHNLVDRVVSSHEIVQTHKRKHRKYDSFRARKDDHHTSTLCCTATSALIPADDLCSNDNEYTSGSTHDLEIVTSRTAAFTARGSNYHPDISANNDEVIPTASTLVTSCSTADEPHTCYPSEAGSLNEISSISCSTSSIGSGQTCDFEHIDYAEHKRIQEMTVNICDRQAKQHAHESGISSLRQFPSEAGEVDAEATYNQGIDVKESEIETKETVHASLQITLDGSDHRRGSKSSYGSQLPMSECHEVEADSVVGKQRSWWSKCRTALPIVPLPATGSELTLSYAAVNAQESEAAARDIGHQRPHELRSFKCVPYLSDRKSVV